jgi:hypothetical protein
MAGRMRRWQHRVHGIGDGPDFAAIHAVTAVVTGQARAARLADEQRLAYGNHPKAQLLARATTDPL